MDTTTTTEPASKRGRNSSVVLTDRMCEKRVAKRVKIYDRKCPGLYVSITSAGVATFSFKFTDPTTAKQRTGWLGVYNPETFTVEDARSRVYGLRGTGAAVLAETFRDRKVQQAKKGKTVDDIIGERIEWMKTPVRKPDGEMRPHQRRGRLGLFARHPPERLTVVTRRKYKARSVGHAPMPADGVAVTAQAPPAAPEPTSQPDDANPLQRALEAQQHAEDLHRQHAQRQQIGLQEPPIDAAQRQAIDAHVDAMRDISEHKRRFLKSHPSLLVEPHVKLVPHAYQMALHAGIPEDAPQFDRALLAGVAKDIEHHRQLAALTSPAQPTPVNHQAHHAVDQAAAELAREAETHAAAQPASVPQRRSMPMSAPVSRNAPSASGSRHPADSNTLTAEERQIARNSFSDPRMSNEQKELLYLRNRQKLHAMRRDGTYSEQRG